MEEVIDNLPNCPADHEYIFELMQSPRLVGHAIPSFQTDGGCVGFYFEHEGAVKALGYSGSEWVQIGSVHDDVGEIYHDKAICDAYVDDFHRDLISLRGDDFGSVGMDMQFESPAGFQLKMCIRHRGLSSDDFHMLNSYPQFADVEAIWGNPTDGIVGVAALERDVDNPTAGNIVFAYYNPEIGVWRIVDVIKLSEQPILGDKLHAETEDQLREHYNELDMITGPA